jgi:hypothetical protein
MSPKSSGMTTLNIPRPSADAGSPAPADFTSQWQEARLVYPIYAALATQFELAPLPYASEKLLPEKPARESFDGVLKWLASVDQKTLAYQIRQLPSNVLNGSEAALRALIHRQLKKAEKTTADRDKIDLLLVQYFAMCASEEMVRREIGLDEVARILQPVLSEADPTPLEWCDPLEKILDKTKQCHSLRDMMEDGLLEQGRMLKDEAGPMFYDPAALVAFCRFNFLLRRAFIRMLHADLSAVRDALDALETKGVKTADCRRAGFSAAETTLQLRYFYENWRQPFQKDYTENSVRHSFEQLLALRADLEEALGRKQDGPSFVIEPKKKPAAAKLDLAAHHEDDDMLAMMSSTPADVGSNTPSLDAIMTDKERKARNEAIEAEMHARAQEEEQAASVVASQPAKAEAEAPAAPTAAAEAEKCMEAIWEQLIAVPPSRGRSMSTVVLQDTKVLLSSWEVAAFVEKGSQESEDLRRAVVARALLALASDKRKRNGEERALASALALARTEVSYFQGRVEQAKKAKNTEAAVNLGISTKRLLSCIEEAEALQS